MVVPMFEQSCKERSCQVSSPSILTDEINPGWVSAPLICVPHEPCYNADNIFSTLMKRSCGNKAVSSKDAKAATTGEVVS